MAVKPIHFFQVPASAEALSMSRNHYDPVFLGHVLDGVCDGTEIFDGRSVGRRVRQNQPHYSWGVRGTLNF
jgi:hypothetical protein